MGKGLGTLCLSHPISIILQTLSILTYGAAWLQVLAAPPAHPPWQKSHPAILQLNTLVQDSFERGARPAPWGPARTPAHARTGGWRGRWTEELFLLLRQLHHQFVVGAQGPGRFATF